jgi:hypothetical protein
MAQPEKPVRLNMISHVLKNPHRKSVPRILYESFILLLIYKEIPVHYFSRFLFNREIRNVKDYLPNKFLGEKVTPYFNNDRLKDVLDNKLYFDFFYRQFNVSLPKILLYNHLRIFVIDNKCVEVNTLDEFRSLLDDILNKNSGCDSILIKKTCSSSGGTNIFKIFNKQLQTEPETINELYKTVIKSEFLFQETVRQHPALNRINYSCLNTIRFDTYIDKSGNIDIISAYFRMSLNNAHIDNISSGGCFVSIDLQTGNLKKHGYSMFNSSGLRVFTIHPITNVVFEDFAIPFFHQAKELVLKTAAYMPGLRLVGWDVAIGETEPVIIEGNSNYEIRASDFANGGYLANKTFRKVLREIKYLK